MKNSPFSNYGLNVSFVFFHLDCQTSPLPGPEGVTASQRQYNRKNDDVVFKFVFALVVLCYMLNITSSDLDQLQKQLP